MASPSPFQIGRETGTNIHNSLNRVKDENTIESVLAQAIGSGDPRVVQDSIGKILSQVSPERQGAALQYLQSTYQSMQAKQQQAEQFERERRAGVEPGLHPTLQAAMYKENSKNDRLSRYGLGPQSSSPMQSNKMSPMGQGIGSKSELGTNGSNVPVSQSQPQPTQQEQASRNPFRNMSDDDLILATGAPDREVSEPAKAEMERRNDERTLNQKADDTRRKSHTDISNEVLKKNEEEAQNLVAARSALNLMRDSILNKDLSFFSPDNIAEITGIEGFRSTEGALFKTAGKEFFLGSLNRSGARPNQFIEKQIIEMLPKMGRSTAANLSVARAFENEIDLKEEKVRLTRELSEELEAKLGYVPRNIGQIRDERLKEYAESKQKELNNDLRAYKAIEEKTKQSFMKVTPGTPISKVVAKAIFDQFDPKDPDRVKKAEKQAEELGYVY